LIVCFFSVQTQAGSIPILKDTAKRSPQTTARQTVPTNKNEAVATASAKPTQSIVTLGCEGDISDIKARCSVSVSSSSKHTLSRKSSRSSRLSRKLRKSVRLSGIHKRITSKSVMILDADSGKTLFAKAPDNPRQPASTIKVLTGMIAMKRLKKNERVKVSRRAEKMPRSKIYLSTKKQYKANDLINAVLLASANDASVALAEKIAGSEADFAKLMTLHARLWGAKNTICRTASGLTAKGQQSTARDLAQIFRHAMQDREFARRMKRTKIKTAYGKLLRNHNKALWRVEGALAGKTGYTNLARQTYVGQFKRGDDTIVVAIMGSETMWRDIKRLVEYGFQKKKQIRIAQLTKAETGSQ
jgi:D-alanyl-D-alanine carboxypeptidase (penicillin-binding protein 5/6)